MDKLLLMVATEKGAFLLEGDGARKHWKMTGPLMKGWKVLHLDLDQRSKPVMTACVGSWVYGAVIQRSEDMGQTWTQIEQGPAFDADSGHRLNNIWCVSPGHAEEPQVYYAGVDEAAIFRSEDGGHTWTELAGLSGHPTRDEWVGGAGGMCCHSIIVDPGDRNRIWVGISAVGVFRSDDRGETWQTRNKGLQPALEAKKNKDIGVCVHRLVIDEKRPTRLYQQNHRGVFRSEDAGDSWERIEEGLPCNFGFPMVVHPHNPDIVYIVPQESDEFRFAPGGRLAVYRTTDGGDHWQESRNGLPDGHYVGVLRQAMAADPLSPCGIYFGTSGGQLYHSRNEGETWEQLPFVLPRINSVSARLI